MENVFWVSYWFEHIMCLSESDPGRALISTNNNHAFVMTFERCLQGPSKIHSLFTQRLTLALASVDRHGVYNSKTIWIITTFISWLHSSEVLAEMWFRSPLIQCFNSGWNHRRRCFLSWCFIGECNTTVFELIENVILRVLPLEFLAYYFEIGVKL